MDKVPSSQVEKSGDTQHPVVCPGLGGNASYSREGESVRGVADVPPWDTEQLNGNGQTLGASDLTVTELGSSWGSMAPGISEYGTQDFPVSTTGVPPDSDVYLYATIDDGNTSYTDYSEERVYVAGYRTGWGVNDNDRIHIRRDVSRANPHISGIPK